MSLTLGEKRLRSAKASKAWRARNPRTPAQRRLATKWQREWRRARATPETRQRAALYQLEWVHRNLKRVLARKRLRAYGVSGTEVEELLSRQGETCAICRGVLSIYTARVDHSHETHAVRGLLCGSCNSGIGFFHDSVVSLAAAIKYLEGSGR